MIKYTETWDCHILLGDNRYTFLSIIKGILPDISDKRLAIALPFIDNERIKPILDWIQNRISDADSLKSIGSQFGLDERSLSRLFQSTLDISFLQYLKLLRIVKAIELMLQTDLSISEIAYAVGYSSLSSFSNTFYQLTNFRHSDFKRDL